MLDLTPDELREIADNVAVALLREKSFDYAQLPRLFLEILPCRLRLWETDVHLPLQLRLLDKDMQGTSTQLFAAWKDYKATVELAISALTSK